MSSSMSLLAISLLIFPIYIIIANPADQSKNATAPQSAQAASPSPVKNGTAPGRYGGGGGGNNGGYGYGGGGGGYSGEYEVAYGHSQRLVDDYVCDLDASILVVTNSEKQYQKESSYGDGGGYGQKEEGYGGGSKSGYAAGRTEAKRAKRGAPNYGSGEEEEEGGYGSKGYGQKNGGGGGGYGGNDNYGQKDYGHTNTYSVAKAYRLRCSAIAVNSDEDCKKCCHMAARKERSMSKESILGFIVDYDEIRQSENGYEPSGPYRMKRNAEPVYAPAAKPEDYQYGGGYQQQQQQQQQEYGQQMSYGQGEQQSGYGEKQGGGGYGNGYQKFSSPSYGNSDYSYNYPQRPKNPRCVCCAPKASAPAPNREYGYGNKGGYEEKKQNYGGEYGQDGNNNEYGNVDYGSSSREQQRQEEGGGYGNEGGMEEKEGEEYGPRAPPKQNYGGGGGGRRYEQGGGEYGQQQQQNGHGHREYGNGNEGRGRMKGRKYRQNKGPY